MAREKTPKFIHDQQKAKAKHRGIEWQFTFETWWEVWEQSGKWEQRGCRRGQFVMSRHNDSGPYSPTNVAIVEAGQNGSAALKGWGEKKRAREAAAAKTLVETIPVS